MGPPGHFGIAFAVKPLAPKAPLLLAASEALDLLSLSFIATGIEDVGVSSTNLKQGLKSWFQHRSRGHMGFSCRLYGRSCLLLSLSSSGGINARAE